MKRILSILLVVLMMMGSVPGMVFAAENESIVIYTGSSWPFSYYYVESVSLSGANVSYTDGFNIYLDHETAADAQITLEVTAGGRSSGNLGINWNDDATNTKTYTTNLVDGQATVKVYAYKASGAGVSRSGTNTFKFYTAEPNESPVLKEGVQAETTSSVFYNESYTLDLNSVFADADADELAYTVSVNGAAAVSADASYSYSNAVVGTYTLVFTATDGKTAEASRPTHKVTLTVKNSETTYDVDVTVPDGVTPEFYAVNELKSGTTVKGDKLTYAEGVVKVPENVSRIMWEADGRISSSATVNSTDGLTLVDVTFDCSLEGSIGGDTVESVEITDIDGVKISGTASDTFLLATIQTVTYTLTTSASGYNVAELKDQTPQAGKIAVEFSLKNFKVIAPKGSVVSAGNLQGSFNYTFITPIDITEGEETVTYRFAPLTAGGGKTAFVRVQRPDDSDAVTYWDWKSAKTDGKTITITEEMLFMGDGEEDKFDDDTVYRNFEKFEMDLADIYMNINNAGYINLNVGDTKGLNMFRNFQAINSFINDAISLPDFDYEIINIEGEDVITITPDKNNSAAATLQATGEGTAIVLVTYDAMYSDSTVKNSNGDAGGGNRYSAIWPDRTGVFVVSVGKDGTAIKSNMTCNGNIFDAEHSPQFYTDDDGAEVTFVPEEGVKVTVNRSTVGKETLSFGEFTDEGVTVAEDGTVTVSGLTTGRHILRFEKDGVYGYQVVTAQQVSVKYFDVNGNELPEGFYVAPGRTIIAKIKGITNPAEKFATKYNFNCQLYYTDQSGNVYRNSSGAVFGKYNFSASEQVLEITVPETVETGTTLTLNGYVLVGGFSGDSVGGHRKVTYGTASGMASGSEAGLQLGTLPEINIDVKVIPATAVTLDRSEIVLEASSEEAIKATVVPSDTTDIITWTSADETIATVSETGVVKGMKAGKTTITATINGLSASCEVEVYGMPNEFFIETGSATPTSSAGRALKTIALAGPRGLLLDGYTETSYTIELAADTDKTQPVQIEMTGLLRNLSSTPTIYYWANTSAAKVRSASDMNAEPVGKVTVMPVWDENNEAVITVGLGTSSAIATGYQKTTYTIRLRIHDEHIEQILPAVEATYHSEGLTEGKVCSFCGETIVPQEVIPRIPAYEYEIVFDKDEYAENDNVTAKVYVKKLIEGEFDANVFGYALSFNKESFVLKGANAENGLTDELSDSIKGLVSRKLMVDAQNEEGFVVDENGILIDTLTFKAYADGKLDCGFTAVEDDVDLSQFGSFVTVFVDGEAVSAEKYRAEGKVTYTRIVENDKISADRIEELIAVIGDKVEFTDFAAIEEARKSYDEAEEEVKQYVENYIVLETAEKLKDLWAKGDIDVSGVINAQDLSVILGTYGDEVTERNIHCDINKDEMSLGLINGGDLSIVIANYATKVK